jgi:hypothetical protein
MRLIVELTRSAPDAKRRTPKRKIVAVKAETVFRNRAQKDLNKLPNWKDFSIQQLAKFGDPDKLCCCRGLFIAIEFKSSAGKPTKLQRKILTDINAAGGVVFVAYPSNWDAIYIELQAWAERGVPISPNQTRSDLWEIEATERGETDDQSPV